MPPGRKHSTATPTSTGCETERERSAGRRSERFGMVTAANPGYLPRSDAEGRAADVVLQRELERRGLHHRFRLRRGPQPELARAQLVGDQSG